jgi:hypothetical protein
MDNVKTLLLAEDTVFAGIFFVVGYVAASGGLDNVLVYLT